MQLYALFLCLFSTGTCVQQREMTFQTLKECQQAAAVASHLAPTQDGRYPYVNDSGRQGWFECRTKHIETWEPVPAR